MRIVATAQGAVADYAPVIDRLAATEFTRPSINTAVRAIRLLEGMEESFPSVSVIFYGTLPGTDREVFWHLDRHDTLSSKEDCSQECDLWGANFIHAVSPEERAYLEAAFAGETTDHLFSADGSRYELYYPVAVDGRVIVLYLSDQKRYGKIGS